MVAGAYLAAYGLFDLTARDHALFGLADGPWHPGVAFGFVLVARFGFGWAPLTFVAPLLCHPMVGAPLAAVAEALAEGLICSIAALEFSKGDVRLPGLDRLPGLLRFFVVILLAACVAAAVRAMTAPLHGPIDIAAFAPIGLRTGLSFLVAMALVVPALLIHRPWRWQPSRRLLSVETALQVVALGVIAWEVLGRFANEEIHFFYLLFLPVAWIATRHGQKGASLALIAIFAAALLSDRLVQHHDRAIIELQIRLLALAATGLLLGATVSERQAAELRMQARQTELARLQRLNVGREMASALAHELNQPLTAAMNYTQAAQRLLRTPSSERERIAEIVGKAIDRIERVGHIISGLRDFMRKGEMRLAQASVRDLIEDALQLVSAEASAAGIVVDTPPHPALPPVLVDKTQIVQVLVNLLRNAVQAVAAAGEGEAMVQVSAYPDEGSVRIAVTDNGPGIPGEVLARLFEPFVTTKEAGMGLGLSISKSILESHGGRLWGENGPTGGAVFNLSLPVALEEKRYD
ncbi:MAG: ATP-binding protein [Magnetospirillum sp. WYHS-4]